MYKLIRPLLFCFSPEYIHTIIIGMLKMMHYVPFDDRIVRLVFNYRNPKLEREVFGIKFRNPVGLAAGFDKNGDSYNLISNFGFGFVEIGSITPKAQKGNPKPRCFRLPQDKAIINRMGINNNGVKYAVEQLKKVKPHCIIGGNLSKNASTSNENAAKDYEKSFALLYDFVDYFTINVSCPNVKDLDKLQDIDNLSEIIDRLLTLRRYFDDYRPILLKISPDIPYKLLDAIIDLIMASGLDGVIATNTTRNREKLKSPEQLVNEIGDGGLSGAPLFEKSLEIVKYIHNNTNGQLPIIAVGGIMTPEDALKMLNAGASLIQVYTGFIYNGPGFAKKINKFLAKRL